MKIAKEFYEKNIKEVNIKLRYLEKIINVFAIIRLLMVLCVIAIGYYFYKKDNLVALVTVALLFSVMFIIIAIIHNNKISIKKKYEVIIKYNKDGLKRINGQWRSFQDKGQEFKHNDHGFINDLDIFGDNSLFQWINTTNTEFGRKALSEKLKIDKTPSNYEIAQLQEAIKELVEDRKFAEQIYISSYNNNKSKGDIKNIIEWLSHKEKIGSTLTFVPYIFIASTFIFAFMVITKRLSMSYLLLMFMINYLVVKLLTKNLSDVLNLFIDNKANIFQYSNILNIIEAKDFKSGKMKNIKSKLRKANNNCNKEMKKLKNLVNWLGDSQANAYYLLLNVTILSDTFILKNLKRWKLDNGENFKEWIEVIGEIEALVSLSNLAFENNHWVYPNISKKKEVLAVDMGHPMIGETAMVNSFVLGDNKKVALITGSNMSGKSTFLRTIGINMVLAYLGLPVYAREFKCGVFSIYTCMRTQDNLEENISSFYAEILRIKLLIDSGKEGKDIFFLLDEIFKGTNSIDRHDGARILINQLVNNGAIGLVSTHDLELCDLENTKVWLTNYNFQEYYENGKIKFDYKLRKGKSTTRNAKHLMKLAGINIE